MQRLGLINVIKVRSRLDIAEHRLPQGGRFVTRAGNRSSTSGRRPSPACTVSTW
jgi:type II secretory ATPase GspE/PulE/Tfp pilus assembly ATPase PilB-like protein